MATVIGPFIVNNATEAQLNDVRAVVANLPAPMRVPDGPLVNVDFGSRPSAAPSWAIGFHRKVNDFWVKPGLNSSLRRYVIAHEFWHEWSRSHTNTEQSVRKLIVGPTGNQQNANWTNDPDEAMAHGFAKAIGFSGLNNYDFRAYIPASSYSFLIQILNGSSMNNPPVPTGNNANSSPNKPGGNTGNYTNDPNQARALAFLRWWQSSGPVEHNAASTWVGVVTKFAEQTGDTQTAAWILSLFSGLGQDPTVPIGPFAVDTPIYRYLERVANTTGNDLFFQSGSFFQPIFDFVDGIIPDISHGFFFIVLLVIGVAILLAGVKAGAKPQGATA
jgi:hypothetical protein